MPKCLHHAEYVVLWLLKLSCSKARIYYFFLASGICMYLCSCVCCCVDALHMPSFSCRSQQLMSGVRCLPQQLSPLLCETGPLTEPDSLTRRDKPLPPPLQACLSWFGKLHWKGTLLRDWSQMLDEEGLFYMSGPCTSHLFILLKFIHLWLCGT